MAAARLAAATLGCVLVAACGQAAQQGDAGSAQGTAASASTARSSSAPEMSVSCSGRQAGLGGDVATLPRGITVTGARVCKQLVVPRPGLGTWQKTVTYEVVGGLDRLVRAYQRPDGRSGSGPCDLVGHIPLLVTFTTSRGQVEAREPRGTCGHPLESGVSVYDALTLREISSVWNSQISSQRADDTGCAEQWKDMLWVERHRNAATASPQLSSGAQRLCVYRDPAPSMAGGDPHLSAAGTVTPVLASTLVGHLHPAKPSTCPSGPATYAVLGEPLPGESAGDAVYVSLDACRGRALWGSGSGTLDAAGLRLLDQLVGHLR